MAAKSPIALADAATLAIATVFEVRSKASRLEEDILERIKGSTIAAKKLALADVNNRTVPLNLHACLGALTVRGNSSTAR